MQALVKRKLNSFLISDEVDFRVRNIIREKDKHYITINFLGKHNSPKRICIKLQRCKFHKGKKKV